MRQSKFEVLVNLYLDGEITRKELMALCRELEKSPKRRAIFESYLRLNQAACKARFTTACLISEARELREPRSFIWAVWGGASGALLAVALFVFMGWSEVPSSGTPRPAPLFAQARMEVDGYNPRPALSAVDFRLDPELVELPAHVSFPSQQAIPAELRQISLPQLHAILARQDLRYLKGQLIRLPNHPELDQGTNGYGAPVAPVNGSGFMQVSFPAR